MIQSTGNLLPIPEILQVSLDGRRGEHEALIQNHGRAVETVMRFVCQGAQIVRPVHKGQPDPQEAIMWFIDSRIDDGRIDYATRLRAVVTPVSENAQPEELVVPTPIRRQAYWQPWKRSDPQWAPGLRGLGCSGVHIQSLTAWPEVPMHSMQPHEQTIHAKGNAQFTHVYQLGQDRHEDRYKADHRSVRPLEIVGVPSYDMVTARAYGKFVLGSVETILRKERAAPSELSLGQTLTVAGRKDSYDQTIPPQQFGEYANATRSEAAPSRQLSDLAVSLSTSSPGEPGLHLAGWLIDPAAPQVASWGLMRKDMYEGAVRRAGHAGLITHSLHWVVAHAEQVRTAFYNRLGDNADVFEGILNAELREVAADVSAAEYIQRHLETEVIPVPEDWRKVAIT